VPEGELLGDTITIYYEKVRKQRKKPPAGE